MAILPTHYLPNAGKFVLVGYNRDTANVGQFLVARDPDLELNDS